MKYVVRVDASPELGSGHLMRTSTLADELHLRGHQVRFVSRRLPEHLARHVLQRGHLVTMLAENGWTLPGANGWEVAVQEGDAADSVSHARDADWVICDHYGLGAAWERAVRAVGARVMAIDDIGRTHDCDVLLDQNYYSELSEQYAGSAAGAMLLGPNFALLRPEFAALHDTVRPREGHVRRLLLCMGGSDAADATSAALDAIEQADIAVIALDIVIGAGHPGREAIAARCDANPNWTLHIQTSDLPSLMAAADFAIGAGGTMTWERCAVGLPTLAVELAPNQREVLREASRAGLLYYCDEPLTSGSLARHLGALAVNSGLRHHLSLRSLSVTDGRGAARVASALGRGEIVIRRAEQRDCDPVYHWRNAPEIRAVSRMRGELSIAEHREWFARTLTNPDRWLLIGERGGSPVGVVRFDLTAPHMVDVSIYLVPGEAHRGAGAPLLIAAEKWLSAIAPEIEMVTAEIMVGNDRSERLFTRCGYKRMAVQYSKELRRGREDELSD